MKKLLTILGLFVSLSLSASHILGGMLVVSQASQDSTSIGAYFIMDQQGIIPPKQYVSQYEFVNGFYNYTGSVELSNPITSIHQGTYLVQYSSDYLDLDSNKYRFVASHCCWGFLNNSSNSSTSNLVISVDYWHIPNNSTPYMENPMWINVEKNKVNVMKPIWGIFNCFFTNPDGDSVNLHMTELYSSYSNGVFVPQVQTSTNILANNDSITFVGTHLGPKGYGFQIDKYRSGYLLTTQRIQWTFIVRSSTLNIEESQIKKEIIGKWDWHGRQVKALEPHKFYVIRYGDGSFEKVFIVD